MTGVRNLTYDKRPHAVCFHSKMFTMSKITWIESSSVVSRDCGCKEVWGMVAKEGSVSFWGDETVPQLCGGDGCRIP